MKTQINGLKTLKRFILRTFCRPNELLLYQQLTQNSAQSVNTILLNCFKNILENKSRKCSYNPKSSKNINSFQTYITNRGMGELSKLWTQFIYLTIGENLNWLQKLYEIVSNFFIWIFRMVENLVIYLTCHWFLCIITQFNFHE